MKQAGLTLICSLRLTGLCLMAALTLPGALLAQTSVSVMGVVIDESGAAIPGASVALVGPDPGGTHRTVSQQDGSFTIENVTPAGYTLRIELSGFETYQKPTPVGPDGLKALRVTLRLARVEQSVTVEADAVDDALTAGSNTATARLDENLIQELPLAADNLLTVIGNFIAPIGVGAEGPSIVVDGVSGGDLDVPSTALDRVRVNRNPYSAEFQYPGSARLDVSTRRGHRSRRLDGGLQTTSRSSIFAARHPIARSVPDLDRRLLQAHVGGALRRNASFQFAAKRSVNDESAIVNAITLDGPIVANVPRSQRHDNLFTRLQWWPTPLNTIYLTYGYSDRAYRNRGTGGFNLPERAFGSDERRHKVTLTQNILLPPNWSNTLVGTVATQDERSGGAAAAPAIVVTQAFAAGPTQLFASDRKGTFDLQNTTQYHGARGHTLRFGARLQRTATDARDQSNFGGTFEFASLRQWAAGTPLTFRIIQGDPEAAFTVYKAHGFLQDEMAVARDLTVTAGLRYDWQSTVGDRNNVAPRLGMAWVPSGSKKTVVRGGAGLFYDDLPRAATERSLLFDGVRLSETVIADPSYPDPFGSGRIVTPPPSTVRLAPDLQSPYVLQASVGFEQELWARNRIAAEYMVTRGENQFRSRNINAPPPGNGRRPDQAFLNVNQVESTGHARSQAVTVSWQGRVGKVFRPYLQYVLSKTTNDTAGLFSLPADNFALAAENGPADFDRRHRLNLMGTLALPKAVQTGLVLSVGSGLPYDITTGFDDNGDTLANDRPRGVTRNTGRGPYTVQLDLRLTKTLARSRRGDQGQKRDGVDVMVDVFNATNHTNVDGIVGALSSPFFGRFNSAAAARTVQFSVKYSFRR